MNTNSLFGMEVVQYLEMADATEYLLEAMSSVDLVPLSFKKFIKFQALEGRVDFYFTLKDKFVIERKGQMIIEQFKMDYTVGQGILYQLGAFEKQMNLRVLNLPNCMIDVALFNAEIIKLINWFRFTIVSSLKNSSYLLS